MAELDRAAISARIAEARDKRAGLKQTEFADLLKVHWRTVQDWESLKNPTIPWDRLEEIAKATGVDKEWLLHGDREEAGAGDIKQDLQDHFDGRIDEMNKKLEELLELARARAATGG